MGAIDVLCINAVSLHWFREAINSGDVVAINGLRYAGILDLIIIINTGIVTPLRANYYASVSYVEVRLTF